MTENYQDDTLRIFSLNANRPLAEKIAASVGTELGKSTVRQFSDGEIQINIEESIRGDHVYIIQATNAPVNDHLMELLILIDGLFRYQFLQNALLTSIIVGLISGVIGSFIILRGMSLMGDAISHAVLPGVAVSYMFGFNYIFGASIFGLLAALSIGFITQKS